jgi:hypothetical protein
MKLKLNNEDLAEVFLEECLIFGIVAPVRNYQFVSSINRYMGCSFRLNNDLEIQLRNKSRNYHFSIFEYEVPQTTNWYYLYHNQHMGEYLLPEVKHLDFLWMVRGDAIVGEDIQGLQQSIRNLPAVQFVSELTPDKIKNKTNLIF